MSSHDTAFDPSHLISCDITLVQSPELQDRPLSDHLVLIEVENNKFFTQNASVPLSKLILTFLPYRGEPMSLELCMLISHELNENLVCPH